MSSIADGFGGRWMICGWWLGGWWLGDRGEWDGNKWFWCLNKGTYWDGFDEKKKRILVADGLIKGDEMIKREIMEMIEESSALIPR